MLYSLICAFMMYSRIPMPQIPWSAKNRRYALCFFPVIGAVIGGLMLGWYMLAQKLSLPSVVFAVVGTSLPLLVTGGIHLDGFCDTEDARASFADQKRRLEIMSDPHIGSFAVMRLVMYLLMQTAFLSILSGFRAVCVLSCGFVLSRTMSALAAVTLPGAKKNGTLQAFVKPAHRKITLTVLVCIWLATAGGMLLLSLKIAIICLVVCWYLFIYYYLFSLHTFGGITGDTEGWFLQKCELLTLIACALTQWAEVHKWF